MAFIKPVWFKAELLPTAVMEFISRTPPEMYFLVPNDTLIYYGMVIQEDMVEYLCNEFKVLDLEIVSANDVKKAATKPGCTIWGNRDLIDF
jgi:hypothetical protein